MEQVTTANSKKSKFLKNIKSKKQFNQENQEFNDYFEIQGRTKRVLTCQPQMLKFRDIKHIKPINETLQEEAFKESKEASQLEDDAGVIIDENIDKDSTEITSQIEEQEVDQWIAFNPSEQKYELNQNHQPGEIYSSDQFNSLECKIVCNQLPKQNDGILRLTNFRIAFFPLDETLLQNNSLRNNFFLVPYTAISKVTKKGQQKLFFDFELEVKDGRIFTFKFSQKYMKANNISIEKLIDKIKYMSCPTQKEDLFAYRYFQSDTSINTLSNGQNSWDIFNSKNFALEFNELGIKIRPLDESKQSPKEKYYWKIVDNSKGQICSTYPQYFVVPDFMNPQEIIKCSEFRTRNRLPALIYAYTNEKQKVITLWRSSQNKPGITGARNEDDEKMLQLIGRPDVQPNKNMVKDYKEQDFPKTVHVYDARPFLYAYGNKIHKSAGFENTKNYKNCEIFFMGIDNIHGVHESYNKMISLFVNEEKYSKNWNTQVDQTKWLQILQAVLLAGKAVASSIKEGYSVLVHCSDGWDRTTQMISLSQIILDNKFRTMQGFMKLVQKDWVCFGHQFHKRLGLNPDAQHETSEVFIQFLDCVHQLLKQFPLSFEFNQKFLVDIAFHLYSSQFGTFIANCEQEILEQELNKNTASIWGHLDRNKLNYLNHFYLKNQENSIIFPNCHQNSLFIWNEYFGYFSQITQNHYQNNDAFFTEQNKDLIAENLKIQQDNFKQQVNNANSEFNKFLKQLAVKNSLSEDLSKEIKNQLNILIEKNL